MLAAVPLFAGCSNQQLKLIGRWGEYLSRPAGTELIPHGQEFLVILTGEVTVRYPCGQPEIVGAGGYVGEIALLAEAPNDATITTESPTELLVFERRVFVAMLDACLTIDRRIAQHLAVRLWVERGLCGARHS